MLVSSLAITACGSDKGEEPGEKPVEPPVVTQKYVTFTSFYQRAGACC